MPTFLGGRQILAGEVLADGGQFRPQFVEGDDLDAHLGTSELTCGAQSAVAGQEFVLAVPLRQDEQRVQHPDGRDRLQEVLEVHTLAAMVAVGDDLDAVDGDRQDLHWCRRLRRG